MGASAGGLEALTALFSGLPPAVGLGIVIVQHLDPTHRSGLIELVSRTTKMRVQEATDGGAVLGDNVYVIPPNKALTIRSGRLQIRPRRRHDGIQFPINTFLASLARDQGAKAVAVILSGTGTDGAAGTQAVKSAGGVVFAQEPKSAGYAGMPEAAVASGDVDFVLSARGIGRKLGEIVRHPERRIAAKPRTRGPVRAEPGEGAIETILELLLKTTGVDYRYYRRPSITRRIKLRMAKVLVPDLDAYLELARHDPAELWALHEDILVPVTSFFRDPPAFDLLKQKVFPALLRDRPTNAPVRVWVAGCSTGEEAYSIAMLFLEFQEDRKAKVPLQLFATDASETAIRKARAGIYSRRAMQAVSPARIQKFFTHAQEGDSFQISKEVRACCVFAKHDLNRNPPFSKVDFISCRNVLIYLDRPLQDRVLPIFHYALNPRGFLLLGGAESLPRHAGLFTVSDSKHKLFVKGSGKDARLPELLQPERIGNTFLPAPSRAPPLPAAVQGPLLARFMDDALDEKTGLAAILINANLDILLVRGDCNPYLQVPRGQPVLNLNEMARDFLAAEISNAVGRARKSKRPVLVPGLPVLSGGSVMKVGIEVRPLPLEADSTGFLVIFQPSPATPVDGSPSDRRASARGQGVRGRQQMEFLRRQLRAVKLQLEKKLGDQESLNEELRVANEEIQAANEELQSTNEELETSREELQSTNEELTTLNEELANANVEMRRGAEYLESVLTGAKFPVIVLGTNLRIRHFTSPVQEIMNILPSDVGRPLGDIAHTIGGSRLLDAVSKVLNTDEIRKLEITDPDGHFYEIIARSFRSTGKEPGGVILTFTDIDVRKREAEAGQKRLVDEQARGMASEKAVVEKEVLLREIHHRVKNNLQVISSMVHLQSQAEDDPHFRSALQATRDRVAAMALVHEKLYRSKAIGRITFSDYLRDLVRELHRAYSADPRAVRVNVDMVDAEVDLDTAIHLGLIVNELASNAFKHAFPPGRTGTLHVSLKRVAKGDLELAIQDDGVGMPPTVDWKAPKTLGLKLLQGLVEQVGGTVHVSGVKGVTARVRFPPKQAPLQTQERRL